MDLVRFQQQVARRVLGARRARAVRERLQGEAGLRESRFAPPREHCPNPQWWHTVDVEATEFEVTEAVAGLVRALQPEYVVETGTASAQTAIAIGKALRANGHGRLVTLEVDSDLVRHGRALTRGLPVEVRHQPSLEFTPEHPVDFAWLDSLTHLRHLEYRRYYPHMHARTIVGFHDTAAHHPTRAYIDELESEGVVKAIDLPSPRGFTLGQVLGR